MSENLQTAFYCILISTLVLSLWPVSLVASAEGSGVPDFQAQIFARFLSGLLRLAIVRQPDGSHFECRVFGLTVWRRCPSAKTSASTPHVTNQPSDDAIKTPRRFEGLGSWLWQKRRKFLNWFRWAWESFSEKHLQADLWFGFSDPATTGEVYGYYCVAACALPTDFHLRAHPCFLQRALAGRLAARVSFVPLRVVLSLTAIGLDALRTLKGLPWTKK